MRPKDLNMKTCECGGTLYRHGTTINRSGQESMRYRCKVCGKTFRVDQNGRRVSRMEGAGRPMIKDWRMV